MERGMTWEWMVVWWRDEVACLVKSFHGNSKKADGGWFPSRWFRRSENWPSWHFDFERQNGQSHFIRLQITDEIGLETDFSLSRLYGVWESSAFLSIVLVAYFPTSTKHGTEMSFIISRHGSWKWFMIPTMPFAVVHLSFFWVINNCGWFFFV